MSYCRFSSEEFQSDVYVYSDCRGGITTHVAGRRRAFKEPLPARVPLEDVERYLVYHQELMRIVEGAELVPIGLQHDGATFNDPDEAACADRLEGLRALGYRVPQYAIDALREEAREIRD